jgi:hypothetical protein
MTSRGKAVIGVVLIFFLGFAAGGVATSIYAHWKIAQVLKHPGQALMAAMEKNLTKNLDLDDNQKHQIHGYFMDNLKQHKLAQALILPQIQKLNQTTVQQIRAALRPEQLKRFDENLNDLSSRYWKYSTSQETAPASQPEVGSTNTAPDVPPATP